MSESISRSRRTDIGLPVNYLNLSVCPSFAEPMLESAIVFHPRVDLKLVSP